jgi:hypothetical protein
MADDTNLWDDIFTTNIDDYTYDADDYSIESYLNNDATNYYGADDFDYDLDWGGDEYDVGSADFSSWLDSYLDDPFGLNDEDDKNYYGADDYSWIDDHEYGDDIPNVENMDFTPEGQISSWMDNYFEEQGYDSNDPYDFGEETGPFGGTLGPKVRDFFANFFGLSGGSNNKKTGGGIMDLLSSLAGGTKNMLDNDLVKMLLAKKLLDDDRKGGSAAYVPIGQEAYGGGSPLPDYRISNIQPALLPGMAYANQPTTFNNMPPPTAPPPGMQAGGIASLENRMEGPGDVTQAMLEPGEFVMTRKATQNLTPEYLYSLMHQAENAGRMR